MEIKVNISEIIKLGIGPTEYCLLSILHQKNYELLNQLTLIGVLDYVDNKDYIGLMKMLERKGWVKISVDESEFSFKDVHLRQKALDLFDNSGNKGDSKFMTLWTKFPMKVPDGKGGHRVLRSKTSDTHSGKVCKEKWLKIVKADPLQADLMIKGLDKQLETCRGNLQYLNELEFWLNKRVWEKYVDLEEEKETFRERL